MTIDDKNCHTEMFKVRDMRGGDWLWLNKQIMENKNIGSSGKVVYAALAYYANNHNQKCFPSITRLEELTDLTRPTVVGCIGRLEKEKLIKVRRKTGIVNYYTLLEPVKKFNQLEGTSKKEGMTSKKETLPLVKNKHCNNTNVLILNNKEEVVEKTEKIRKEIRENLFKVRH